MSMYGHVHAWTALLCSVYVGEIPILLYIIIAEYAFLEVGTHPKKKNQ